MVARTKTTEDVNELLDALIEKMGLRNDAALAKRLDVHAAVISRLRHRRLSLGPSLLLRMHEESGLTARHLKTLIRSTADVPAPINQGDLRRTKSSVKPNTALKTQGLDSTLRNKDAQRITGKRIRHSFSRKIVALRLVNQGDMPADVAKQLGIAPQTLHNWMSSYPDGEPTMSVELNAAEIQYLFAICVNRYKALNPRQNTPLSSRNAKEVELLRGLHAKLEIFEDPQLKPFLKP